MAWVYCTKEDVEDYLGISSAVFKDSWSEIAEGMIDEHTGRSWGGRATYTEEVDGDGTDTVRLSHVPVSSVSSLSVGGTSVNTSTYKVYESGYIRLIPNALTAVGEAMYSPSPRFPRGVRNITIVYEAGDINIPEKVRLCAMFMIGAIAIVNRRAGVDASITMSYGTKAAGDKSDTYRMQYLPSVLKAVMRSVLGDRARFK